jgi:hypothetical protein
MLPIANEPVNVGRGLTGASGEQLMVAAARPKKR